MELKVGAKVFFQNTRISVSEIVGVIIKGPMIMDGVENWLVSWPEGWSDWYQHFNLVIIGEA